MVRRAAPSPSVRHCLVWTLADELHFAQTNARPRPTSLGLATPRSSGEAASLECSVNSLLFIASSLVPRRSCISFAPFKVVVVVLSLFLFSSSTRLSERTVDTGSGLLSCRSPSFLH
jgi:hypothetical protein